MIEAVDGWRLSTRALPKRRWCGKVNYQDIEHTALNNTITEFSELAIERHSLHILQLNEESQKDMADRRSNMKASASLIQMTLYRRTDILSGMCASWAEEVPIFSVISSYENV